MAMRKVPTVAILTSGGDSQGADCQVIQHQSLTVCAGMNAALRGATRMALDRGADIYAVCEGYDGLVEVRNVIFDLLPR